MINVRRKANKIHLPFPPFYNGREKKQHDSKDLLKERARCGIIYIKIYTNFFFWNITTIIFCMLRTNLFPSRKARNTRKKKENFRENLI